jgi:hypothetical protein
MFGDCSLHLLLFLDGEIPKLKVVFLVVYLDVADPDNIFDVHGAANLVRCRWNRWLPLALHAPIQVIVDEISELDVAVIANLTEPASLLWPLFWFDQLETKYLATLENNWNSLWVLVELADHHFALL